MNVYEINLALRGLQSLESELCRGWEKAQARSPFGALATSLTDELRQVRRLAEKLHQMHREAVVDA